MGMTIEQADKTLLEFYHYIKGDVHCYGFTEDNVLTTIDFIRETMRKYRTMQEVLEKVWNVPSCMLDEAECLNEIMETYRTMR